MAVAPTGAIYKTLTFDGVSSADFGVYITGEAVFNAPERDVEMVTIPGRNGTFALDNGRFENIEVSYPAGIFADTEADFAEAVSEFRNFLCSRNGYVRLEDDYNPSEYRMSVYKSGLEVTPALLKAGEFTLTFDCKPQRWLTSGEEAISVESGDTITNPTRFESGPLLEVEGYGTITVGESEIYVENVPIGDVDILDRDGNAYSNLVGLGNDVVIRQTFKNLDLLNQGDEITCEQYTVNLDIRTNHNYESVSVTNVTGGSVNASVSGRRLSLSFIADASFQYGAASDQFDVSATVTCAITGGGTVTRNVTMTGISIINGKARVIIEIPSAGETGDVLVNVPFHPYIAYSTKPATGHPLYLDCEIGEAWNEDYGTPVSLNNAVSFPPTLPVLALGETAITYENTITDCKVVPRWWRV